LKLAEIIQKIHPVEIQGDLNVEITGITQDSRMVVLGDLFICTKGTKIDSHQFLEQVAASGAVAAIVEDFPAETYGMTIVQVEQISLVLKELAGAFYSYPDQQLQLIAVIGTNGKTTSTYLVKSILETAGYQVGLIGTNTNLIKDQPIATSNTTPGVLELQKLFAQMVAAGVEYVVMEVSSHSIAQGRIAGLNFKSGIFTNITQDHLDYHKTFEEYLRVKTQFFVDLPENSWAAINLDDPNGSGIAAQTKAKVIYYGIEAQADIRAENVQVMPTGASYTVVTTLGQLELKLSLTGYFNVYNSLGALAVGLSLGLDLESIKNGLEKVTGVPGRFQLVSGCNSFGVIVDYAHTPDGLENVLNTARKLNPKRLLLTFGCGGDRDRTKRPIMGALAAKLADLTIITSDNPRSEDPHQIIAEVEKGFQVLSSAKYLIEVDRATAIQKLISLAEPGDIVLIAGKGHETYQIFADHTIHFDDREIAQEALEAKQG